MKKIKSIHGHFSDSLKYEADRIKKYCKEMYDIDVSFTEATALAAERSKDVFWTNKKLKEAIARLRGL